MLMSMIYGRAHEHSKIRYPISTLGWLWLTATRVARGLIDIELEALEVLTIDHYWSLLTIDLKSLTGSQLLIFDGGGGGGGAAPRFYIS